MTTAPALQPPTSPPPGDRQPQPTAGATPYTHNTKAVGILATILAGTGLYAGCGGPLNIITLDQTARHAALYTAAAAALVLLLTVIVSQTRSVRARTTPGQAAVTLGALVCTGVGINTAWGFTDTHLNITDTFTRIALCGTGEIVLIALGLAARDNLKRDGAPGMPGLLVWIITGFLAVPAFAEGSAMAEGFWEGFTAGVWRAIFGPIGAALLWHLAMGLEIRAADATARSMGVLARVARRLGQKVLARFGIADTDTTTTELLQEKARIQAANLLDRYAALSDKRKGGWYGRFLRRRLRAALRAASVAHDETRKAALLADLAVSSHAPALATLKHPSPWEDGPATDSAYVLVAPPAPRGATGSAATDDTSRSATKSPAANVAPPATPDAATPGSATDAVAAEDLRSATPATPPATCGATPGGATPEAVAPQPATSATAATPVAAPSATPRSATPRATEPRSATTPAAPDRTPQTSGTGSLYEPGTAKRIVHDLWTTHGTTPNGPAIADALGEAGLPNSPQQARKIRAQVRAENPDLPGVRAA